MENDEQRARRLLRELMIEGVTRERLGALDETVEDIIAERARLAAESHHFYNGLAKVAKVASAAMDGVE